MTRIVQIFAVLVVVVAGFGPLRAEPSRDVSALIEAMQIAQTIDIMRSEGLAYGDDLANQMIPDADPASWAMTVGRIYSHDKMLAVITESLEAELNETDLGPVLGYFQSADGAEIVALEVAARRAFLDPETEAAAADRYAEKTDTDDPLIDQIEELMADSDLVEFNVAGALNSDLMFYRGLTEGGAFQMTEDEILSDVWAQEEDLRLSSRDWLRSFLFMAYQPLDAEQLAAYAEFYRTPEGRALNRAVFVAFDRMYEEISYLLGLAVAQQMQSEKL